MPFKDKEVYRDYMRGYMRRYRMRCPECGERAIFKEYGYSVEGNLRIPEPTAEIYHCAKCMLLFPVFAEIKPKTDDVMLESNYADK